jgi:hypothetical protein
LGKKMRALLVILFATLSFGFIVETPETLRQRTLTEKKWHEELSAQFDFSALREFLVREIAVHPQVEGIALAKAKVGEKWEPAGNARICGDWLFWADSPRAKKFKISWTYERGAEKNGTILERSVTFCCTRKSKGEFVADHIKRSDDELVLLMP